MPHVLVARSGVGKGWKREKKVSSGRNRNEEIEEMKTLSLAFFPISRFSHFHPRTLRRKQNFGYYLFCFIVVGASRSLSALLEDLRNVH